MLWILALSAAVELAHAKFSNNLNYRSPSENHPALGVSISRVAKRSLNERATIDASQLNFTHGVASGDPYADSVILWTRCAPMADDDKSNATVSGTVPLFWHGPDQTVSNAPICLNWKVTSDKAFSKTVTSGQVYTSSDVDYTVKVEAKGLSAFTQYYYQFTVCNSTKSSPLGRTKTSPKADDKTAAIRFAVYSCSNFPFGFFNAYGNVVRKDSVDYVIHLGDYIYEYANGEYGWGQSIGRVPQPDREIYTLYDYRRRHATYKTDLDLQDSHRSFAWIPVWDDHEVSDNGWKGGASELNNTEESFIKDGGVSVDQRKMNAVRAYFEWMPIRQVDMDDNLRIWRSFQMGDLVDLVLLDTRNYDRSITDLYWNTDYIHDIANDASRSLMGGRQESWFYHELAKSHKKGTAWRLIGSQIVFSRLNESIAYGNTDPLNYDAWDGYMANKNRTLKTLYDNHIGNNIMLSGDSHASWVSDLVWLDTKSYASDSGVGAIGVEFGGSAVTSPCPFGANITLAKATNTSQALVASNPELQYSDVYYRGYFELHITHEKVDAKFFGLPTVVTRNGYEIPIANFTVASGANKLSRPFTQVASGALKTGKMVATNITHDTNNDTWFISHFDQAVL